MGLKLSDLKKAENEFVKINTQHYIDNIFFNIGDSYILDVESYALNSKIRTIQLFDVKEKIVYLFMHGQIKQKSKIIQQLKKYNIAIKFLLFDNEKLMIQNFFSIIKNNPKGICGHNASHFDLGLLLMKKSKYKIKGVHFFNYGVGSGMNGRRVNFSYVVKNKGDDGKWWRDKNKTRFLIIDTLLMAFSLGIPPALKSISKQSGSEFPKKDLGVDGWKVFENNKLDYKPILYAIYDVLSIPDVYNYLRNIIENPTYKFLKIPSKQSQRCVEHIWMKGSGSLAEAFLSKLIGVGVNMETPDYCTKYFGGITRCWNKKLNLSEDNKIIRNLDFNSYYPFSIRKQGIFDILNGQFEYITQKKFHKYADKYGEMIFSSTFRVKAKARTRVIIEGEKHKHKNQIGIGFFRSFNRDKRVQDLQHQLMSGNLLSRGQTTIMTKTEIEMTRAMFPHEFKDLIITDVIDSLIPKSFDKSEKFIQLYKTRQELKNANNIAEKGMKVILNSCYGKLAESKGKWFNLACASAITGYCRATLMKTIMFAEKIGVEMLYSDTDSIYCKGVKSKIKKIQKYAEQFNEHPSRFGNQNLGDEGENIKAFWGIKRKSYVKVVEKNGENVVICKGENGNSDIRWRDVLFRLWALTGGSTDIDEINKKIKNNNLKLEFALSRENDENLKNLNERRDYIKEQLKGLRDTLSKKQTNWIGFYEKIKPIINEPDDFGEYLAVENETSIEYNYYFKKLTKYMGVEYNIKDSNMFLQIFEKLKAEYFEDNELLRLLSNVGGVDLSFYVGGVDEVKQDYNKDLIEVRTKIKNILFEYEKFAENIYKKYNNSYISEIFNVQSKAKITRYYNVHLKKSIGYENGGFYYKKLINAWEKKTDQQAYCGLFFSINRDYSFKEKKSSEFKWNLEYQGYYRDDNSVPIINAKEYENLLLNQIRLDTIRIKTRATISMVRLSDKEKNAITTNLMCMGHCGKVPIQDIQGFPCMFRISTPKDLSIKDTKFINKYTQKELMNTDKNRIYSNATLFINPIKQIDSVCRINKTLMFIKDRNIFNLYRFFSKLGAYLQKLILSKLKEHKRNTKNQFVKGVELDYFPRFTFITQCDINQQVNKQHVRNMHIQAFDSPFYTKSIQQMMKYKIVKYMSIISYNKRDSAEKKIQLYQMQNFEKSTFESEKKEGYRNEIKFELKRNFYETLSYMFCLNAIRQEDFLKFIQIPKSKYSKKHCDFKFSSWINGALEFNNKKCEILFNVYICQVMETRLNEKPKNATPHLDGSWVINGEFPPKNNKFRKV